MALVGGIRQKNGAVVGKRQEIVKKGEWMKIFRYSVLFLLVNNFVYHSFSRSWLPSFETLRSGAGQFFGSQWTQGAMGLIGLIGTLDGGIAWLGYKRNIRNWDAEEKFIKKGQFIVGSAFMLTTFGLRYYFGRFPFAK